MERKIPEIFMWSGLREQKTHEKCLLCMVAKMVDIEVGLFYILKSMYQLDCIVSHHAEMDFVWIDMEADVQTVTGLGEYQLSISFKLSLYNSEQSWFRVWKDLLGRSYHRGAQANSDTMFTKEINKIRN